MLESATVFANPQSGACATFTGPLATAWAPRRDDREPRTRSRRAPDDLLNELEQAATRKTICGAQCFRRNRSGGSDLQARQEHDVFDGVAVGFSR